MNMFSASDQILQYPAPLGSSSLEEKWKSSVELAPNCPRCASANTKFCYYNNYSLSQPRYFCKGCRRYWTKGGSLRNVPVGGGCRRNRKGKSARGTSENERNTISKSFSSFGDNTNEKTGKACSSDDGDSSHKPGGGSDIDLALVFAKFLSESSPSSEPEFGSQELANASNSPTPNGVKNDFSTIESQNPSDHHHVTRDANLLLEEFPQLFDVVDGIQQDEEISVQDLLENDMNAYGLQTMLSDEIAQDVLWTEQAETVPNFTWQPMFQLQDFDSFPADDTQLKASANLVSDNWSSFDLSGFEVYSRPC